VSNLAVIDKGAATATHRTPLLFVHGAFHGAWCWDAHFLDFFADRGYRAVAVNLRGHGSSPLDRPLNDCSVGDYVGDVKAVADSLSETPVVIGHSMGGFVVQKYLAAYPAPAGVLVASAPPRGLAKAMVRVAWRNARYSGRPSALRRPLLFFSNPAVSRSTFYCPDTPEQIVADTTTALRDESTTVLYRDLVYRDLAEPERVRVPMLVLGAALDGFFSTGEVRATARAYRTEAQLFPGMGHNMMLEPGWQRVAERIDAWFRTIEV
jgi:pimeloyl-ACP methyl ester carboxylesterase